jgi:hypothetical protein
MGSLQRIAPIFPVHDLDAALDHYRSLGFEVRVYRGGGYGFASRDNVEIHLGVVPDHDRHTGSAYLFVDNADDLAAAWRRYSTTQGAVLGVVQAWQRRSANSLPPRGGPPVQSA